MESKELFTIIDFETTGLDSEVDQVTELAAIKIDREGNEYGSYHTFIQLTEGRKPSPYAKVTEEQCDTGIEEWEAMQALESFIQHTTVVAQYAPFDFSFLSYHPRSFICTRALSYLLDPDENPSLGPTCERLGIEQLEAHCATDDTLMTKQVLLKQLDRAEEKGIEYRNIVVDFKKRPLRFTPAHAKIIKEL